MMLGVESVRRGAHALSRNRHQQQQPDDTANYAVASPSLQRIVVKKLVPRPVYPADEMDDDDVDASPELVVANEQVGKAAKFAAVKEDKENRLRQRLDACRMGIKQLESLRTKHITLMQDMRKHMHLETTAVDTVTTEYTTHTQVEGDECGVVRSASPAPSSSISHRSSLSMDSGCLSMLSDPSGCIAQNQWKLSLASDESAPKYSAISSYPDEHKLLVCALESAAPVTNANQRSRRNNGRSLPPRPKSAYNYPEENTVVVEENHAPVFGSPRIARSESVHISSPNYAAELTLAVSPPMPVSPSLSMLRQKKTAVHIGGSMRVNPTYRASCIQLNDSNNYNTNNTSIGSPPSRPRPPPPPPPTRSPPSASPSCLRRQSVAWMVCPESYSPPRKQTTWEDVKRMLDPLFEVRKASSSSPPVIHSPLRQRQSTCSSIIAVTPTQARREHMNEHDNLDRTISSQSSDSSKSSPANRSCKKEKDWHESEQL